MERTNTRTKENRNTTPQEMHNRRENELQKLMQNRRNILGKPQKHRLPNLVKEMKMKTYSLRQLTDIVEDEANEETGTETDSDKRWYKYGAILEQKTREKRFILLSDLEKCIDIEVKKNE